MQDQDPVLLICINYRTEDALSGFVESLLEQGDHNWRCLVVDNSMSIAAHPSLNKQLDDSRFSVVVPETNLGYYNGAEFARQRRMEAGTRTPPWTIVSNPDIYLTEDFISSLRSRDPIEVVAPRIISSQVPDQNPFMRSVPTRARSVVRLVLTKSRWLTQAAYFYRDFVKPRLRNTKSNVSQSESVIFAGHGSLIAFPSVYFESGLNFSHPRFLFGEEVWVARQCLRVGVRVRHVPDLVAYHRGHASTGTFRKRQVSSYQKDAASFIYHELRDARRVVQGLAE